MQRAMTGRALGDDRLLVLLEHVDDRSLLGSGNGEGEAADP